MANSNDIRIIEILNNEEIIPEKSAYLFTVTHIHKVYTVPLHRDGRLLFLSGQ